FQALASLSPLRPLLPFLPPPLLLSSLLFSLWPFDLEEFPFTHKWGNDRVNFSFFGVLDFDMAMSLQQCHEAIRLSNGNTTREGWCPATFDTVLCWPATPPGSHSEKPCPPLKGLDPS
ncbi:hypothetical protein PFISCL1PPCAC_10511, partial [Pristionchus fissidentatus]